MGAGPLTVGSALLKIVTDWSQAAQDTEKFKQRTEGSMRSLAGKVGVAMTAASAAVGAAMVVAAKSAATFGESMAKVATLGVEDLDRLKSGVFDLARTYGIDLNDAAKALYDTISAGIPENAAIMVLEQAALGAQAGVGTLNEALDLGTSVMNAYGLKTDDAASTTENFRQIMGLAATAVKDGKTTIAEMAGAIGQLAPIASNAGVSMDELFAGVSALTSGGLGASESMTQLRALIQAIIAPTTSAQQAAQDMGIQFDASALQSKGLAGVLEDVGTATGGDIDKMRLLFTSVEAMGAALSLTGNQAGSFTAALKDMATAQENLTKMAHDFQVENPALAWQQLKGEMQVLAVVVGEAVLPAFREILRAVKPVIEAMGQFAETHPKVAAGLGSIAVALVGVGLVLGPILKLASIAPGFMKLAGAVKTATVAVGAMSGSMTAGAVAAAPWVAAIAAATFGLYKAYQAAKSAKAALDDLNQRMDANRATFLEHVGVLEETTGALDRTTFAGKTLAEQQKVLGAGIRAVAALRRDEQIPAEQKTQQAYWDTANTAMQTASIEIQAVQERMSWWQRLLQAIGDAWRAAWGFFVGGTGNMGGADVPGMATGGTVTAGGLVQVHRDEMVLLPPAAEVIPRGHTQAVSDAMGGGFRKREIVIQAPITIHNPVVFDESHLQKLRDQLGELTGRSITRALAARGLA